MKAGVDWVSWCGKTHALQATPVLRTGATEWIKPRERKLGAGIPNPLVFPLPDCRYNATICSCFCHHSNRMCLFTLWDNCFLLGILPSHENSRRLWAFPGSTLSFAVALGVISVLFWPYGTVPGVLSTPDVLSPLIIAFSVSNDVMAHFTQWVNTQSLSRKTQVQELCRSHDSSFSHSFLVPLGTNVFIAE